MRPKFLNAAARDSAKRKALEHALHAAREEPESESIWVREQGKSFALGALCVLALELLLYLIWVGTR